MKTKNQMHLTYVWLKTQLIASCFSYVEAMQAINAYITETKLAYTLNDFRIEG